MFAQTCLLGVPVSQPLGSNEAFLVGGLGEGGRERSPQSASSATASHSVLGQSTRLMAEKRRCRASPAVRRGALGCFGGAGRRRRADGPREASPGKGKTGAPSVQQAAPRGFRSTQTSPLGARRVLSRFYCFLRCGVLLASSGPAPEVKARMYACMHACMSVCMYAYACACKAKNSRGPLLCRESGRLSVPFAALRAAPASPRADQRPGFVRCSERTECGGEEEGGEGEGEEGEGGGDREGRIWSSRRTGGDASSLKPGPGRLWLPAPIAAAACGRGPAIACERRVSLPLAPGSSVTGRARRKRLGIQKLRHFTKSFQVQLSLALTRIHTGNYMRAFGDKPFRAGHTGAPREHHAGDGNSPHLLWGS